MANTDKVRAVVAAELERKMSDTPRKPFMRFANYEFEGILRQAGDTISVPVSPKITLTDVSSSNSGDIKATSCADITASDRTITHSDLVINKLHQYREKFSDLEDIQTLYSISGERMKDLLEGIDTAVETSIITMLDAYFTAHSSQVTTIASMSTSTVAKDIMGLRTALSKKDVPMDNRILVVSPDVSAVICQAGILSGTEVAADAVVEGWLGKFAGFSIFESNLITSTNVYAFRAKAYNYVRQLVKAKVTEAEAGMYYNILGQVAHGGKIFDQNGEQLYKAEITTIA